MGETLKTYYVNLAGLPNAETLAQRIDAVSWDSYPIAGKPYEYQVMWPDDQESISKLFPEIPDGRIRPF